jgi:3-hydroxyacyl-CoA dehydrogenase
MILLAAHMGMWDQLEEAVTKLQNLNMRMRYFPKPVIVAPAGLALGGGSEITMHGSKVVASSELYAGLVEVGVGVIPAGGGTKEMMRRVLNPPMKTPNADSLPYLQRIFEQIGTAKVGTSAMEVQEMGILSDCDRIVMNRSHLIAEAKKEALRLLESGFHAPLPEKIYAAGRDALAALRVAIYMYWKAKQITDYDQVVAENLANVMTGGAISAPTWVDETYILELEKEAFLSLCGKEETRARMKHMLDTGKPLRN